MRIYKVFQFQAAQSYTGRTALHYAADVNNVTKVRFLLEHNANKDAGDVKDQTPMFLAASRGHLKVVEILIEAGASFEAPDNMVSKLRVYELDNKDIFIF